MVKIIVILAAIGVLVFFGMRFFSGAEKPKEAKAMKSIYDYSYTSLQGQHVDLKSYRGKKILFVNVASECGFTPQYTDLEKLYEAHKDKLVIIGFPANNFGKQEPGTNEQIATFCTQNYGVTFPMAQKSDVIGDSKNEIYKWLTDKSLNGWNDASPKWNFHKYLVGEDGELLAVFPSTTKPLDADLLRLVTMPQNGQE